jgi:hypothetical protein
VESLGERLGRVGPGAPSSQHNRKVAEFLFDQREHGWLGAIEEKHLLKAELPGEEDFPGWGQKR